MTLERDMAKFFCHRRGCRHSRYAHKHYNLTFWCSLCPDGGCPKFLRVAWPWSRKVTETSAARERVG